MRVTIEANNQTNPTRNDVVDVLETARKVNKLLISGVPQPFEATFIVGRETAQNIFCLRHESQPPVTFDQLFGIPTQIVDGSVLKITFEV